MLRANPVLNIVPCFVGEAWGEAVGFSGSKDGLGVTQTQIWVQASACDLEYVA